MTHKNRKIYLHIGTHKTGSTALQRYLDQNRSYLDINNVKYMSGINQNYAYLLFCEHPEHEHELIRQGLGDAAGASAWVERARRRLNAEILAAGTADILLSAEEFCRLPPSGVRALRSALEQYGDIQIICYVRDPLEYCFSDAQEGLKGGLTYEEICAVPPRPNYREVLEGYYEVFGFENVSVTAYRSDRPVHADFLEILGLQVSDAPAASPARANASLSLEASLILSHINSKYPLYVDACPNPSRAKIAPAWLAKIPGQRFTLPAAVIDRVLAQSASELEWLSTHTGIAFTPETRRAPLEASEPQIDPAFIAAVGELIHELAARLGDVIAAHLTLLAKNEDTADQSERLLEAAIRAHPPAQNAYQALAKIRSNQGRLDEARAFKHTARSLAQAKAAKTAAMDSAE